MKTGKMSLWKLDNFPSTFSSNGKSDGSNHNSLNPFIPNAPFLYPMKASENLMVLCFQGVEKGFIGYEWANWNNVINTHTVQRKSSLLS